MYSLAGEGGLQGSDGFEVAGEVEEAFPAQVFRRRLHPISRPCVFTFSGMGLRFQVFRFETEVLSLCFQVSDSGSRSLARWWRVESSSCG